MFMFLLFQNQQKEINDVPNAIFLIILFIHRYLFKPHLYCCYSFFFHTYETKKELTKKHHVS